MKSENKYTAKQRLLDYLNFKGEKKPSFYQKTGLGNGFLDKNDNINSDKIEIIISVFSDLSAEWLITGEGSMLKSDEKQPNLAPSSMSPQSPPSDIAGLIEVIKTQSKTIEELTRLLGEAQDEVKKTVVPKGARAISATAG